MPTRPSVLYLHDADGTHLVTPTSGHLSDGYVNDEVIGSGETNAYFQNWGLWLQYLGNKQGLVARHVFASGSSGTYSPTLSSLDYVDVWACSGGGGGGAVAAVTPGGGYLGFACSGGCSGEFAYFRVPSVTAGGAYTVGAAGTQGALSLTNATGTGGTGGSTTVTLNGTTITFAGGVGGVGGASAAVSSQIDSITIGPYPTMSINFGASLITPVQSTLGGVVFQYGVDIGRNGAVQILNASGPVYGGAGGDGGSTPFGRGGKGILNSNGGIASAFGYGGGGGGAGLATNISGGSFGYQGGNGGAGILIIDEYMNSL